MRVRMTRKIRHKSTKMLGPLYETENGTGTVGHQPLKIRKARHESFRFANSVGIGVGHAGLVL